MLRERLSIWVPAAFALFLAVIMAYWQFAYVEMERLPAGAFGFLLHIPTIIILLCVTLDRQQRRINGLAAEIRRLSDASDADKTAD
ncbi:MAG TPA: hypothetical protein VND64_04495 [Pirellulales bacterium]|nr:hypothetical protein [Pirellulales bacterium]